MLLLSAATLAFSPWDHRAIAARAVALESADAGRFELAAAAEDWDLPRKWTRWHHYYNPEFTVRSLGRHSSAERVAWLDADLGAALTEGNDAHAWQLAGLLAHHLADMASPPHVVPVEHGLNDGFESYDFGDAIANAGSASVPDLPPIDLQHWLAADTAAALLEPLVCDTATVPWTRLWAPRPGTFGTLGDLRFGRVPGCEAGMRAFAVGRIEGAVAATRALVRRVVHGLGTS